MTPVEAAQRGMGALSIAIGQRMQEVDGLKLLQLGVQGLIQENQELKKKLQDESKKEG